MAITVEKWDDVILVLELMTSLMMMILVFSLDSGSKRFHNF